MKFCENGGRKLGNSKPLSLRARILELDHLGLICQLLSPLSLNFNICKLGILTSTYLQRKWRQCVQSDMHITGTKQALSQC